MTDGDIVFSVRDFFRFLWRGLPLALLLAVVAAASVFLAYRSAEPVYRASATLLSSGARTTRDFDSSFSTPPPIDPGVYRAAILEGPVTVAALGELNAASGAALTPETLLAMTEVTTDRFEASSLINIITESTSAALAAEAANALAQSLLAWDRDRATWQLTNAIAALETQVQTLNKQIAFLTLSRAEEARLAPLTELRAQREGELNLARVLSDSPVGLLEPFTFAEPPREAVPTYLALKMALAALAGWLLGYGLLLLRTVLDTRVRHTELADLVGAPVIAEFARQRGRKRRLPSEPSSYLRINLSNATGDAAPKVILVASSVKGEGKSSVAISLAESFARSNHRTLLLDADLRKPVIGPEYDIDPASTVSLQQYLEEPTRPFAPVRVSIGVSHLLDVVPSFPDVDSADALSREFPALLARWREQYDVLVVDSAPLLSVADTLTFAPLCSGAVLTVSLRDSNYEHVADATELLKRTGVKIFGVAVTKADGARKRYAYRGGSAAHHRQLEPKLHKK